MVMFARRESLLRSEADRIAGTPVVGDIRSPEDLQAAVGASVAAHGGLDIVVLNGGGPPLAAAGDLTDESIVDAFDLLMRPIVRLIGAALPHLRASGQGRIISISSVSVREPIPGLALSNAIRAGVSEDAVAGARSRRRHGQRRRPRLDRHRALDRAVRRRAAPRPNRRNPPRTVRGTGGGWAQWSVSWLRRARRM